MKKVIKMQTVQVERKNLCLLTKNTEFCRKGQNLRENTKCNVVLYGEEVIAIELPNVVTLTVNQTDPGHKGDTAQGALKPATLETGIVVNVPLFINEGNDIRVNTDSGEYVERA